MRRWMMIGIMAAAACGDAASTPDGESDMREPVVCDAGYTLTTMAEMDAFAALGCEEMGFATLNVYGPEIVSLEALRSLRKVSSLSIEDTKVRTLEPLRDLQDVNGALTAKGNEFLSNCELTGWAADVQKRGGRFQILLDEGKNPTQCPTWAYPER